MNDGDAPSSTAQPMSSTGELALPGQGTVASSGRRCGRRHERRVQSAEYTSFPCVQAVSTMWIAPPSQAGLCSCRVLGSREFALFYRQQHRAADPRRSVAINTVLAKCVAASHSIHKPTPAACAQLFPTTI